MAIAKNIRRAVSRLMQHLDSLLRTGPAIRLLSRRPRLDSAPFAAYFADNRRGLYQIAQWLPALERLSSDGSPVLLIVKEPRVAQLLARRTQLAIVLAASSDAVERAVHVHQIRAVFYVNNNQANFTVLRINGPAHIHLSHGESGKVSMFSNQLKAYDYAFVAGDAAVDRIMANVPRFDASHLVRVGRPQLDGIQRRPRDPGSVVTVLYGPTWEGDSSQMAYGSVDTMGALLIRKILAASNLRLIYRPHPKTGQISKSYAAAHNEIRSLISGAGYDLAELDNNPDPYVALAQADVFVGDISAVTMDAIGLGIPTVVCQVNAIPPENSAPTGAESAQSLDESVPHWKALVPTDAAEQLKSMALSGPTDSQLIYREYVFGPEEASATDEFISASMRATRIAESDWPGSQQS